MDVEKKALHMDEGSFQAVGARERANLDGATGPMNSEQDIGHDLEVHCIQEIQPWLVLHR